MSEAPKGDQRLGRAMLMTFLILFIILICTIGIAIGQYCEGQGGCQ